MAETRTTFICSFCGLNKNIKFLNNALAEKADLAVLEKDIESKEELLTELEHQLINANDNIIVSSLSSRIRLEEQNLAELTRRAEKSKREVCSLCVVQGAKRVEMAVFDCEFCKQQKKGTGLKRHIAGFEDRGIQPFRITIVCRQCQNDYAFNPPKDFYCPLTSTGRDISSFDVDDWEEPFDCSCEPPENN